MRYTYYFFLAAAIVYGVVLMRGGIGAFNTDRAGWRLAAIAVAFNIGSYGLIVWALQLTEQVSYVSACRQVSIVMGVIAASVLFHEPGRVVRFVGALCITAGVVVIKVWG